MILLAKQQMRGNRFDGKRVGRPEELHAGRPARLREIHLQRLLAEIEGNLLTRNPARFFMR